MPADPLQLIIKYVPFFIIILLSVSLHEFAHCWTADRLGDDTARRAGRITLNPLKHLDPMGTVMMAVSALSGFGFGWGKASPFNPNNFRHPARDRMLTAIAGPVCNLLQLVAWASIALLCFQLTAVHAPAASLGDDIISPVAHFLMDTTLGKVCFLGMLINASLAVFNLLPVFPLDGHHILSYLAPESWRPIIDDSRWQFVFLAIIFIPALSNLVFGQILQPIIYALLKGTLHMVGLGGL